MILVKLKLTSSRAYLLHQTILLSTSSLPGIHCRVSRWLRPYLDRRRGGGGRQRAGAPPCVWPFACMDWAGHGTQNLKKLRDQWKSRQIKRILPNQTQKKDFTLTESSNHKIIGCSRVSRVVGGWAKRAKKCCAPSKIQNSKKWSRVSLRMLWNRVTMARSWLDPIGGL